MSIRWYSIEYLCSALIPTKIKTVFVLSSFFFYIECIDLCVYGLSIFIFVKHTYTRHYNNQQQICLFSLEDQFVNKTELLALGEELYYRGRCYNFFVNIGTYICAFANDICVIIFGV